MTDILTVMWKEGKGLMRFRGSKSRFWLTILSPVLLATVFPWQWGPEWVEQVPALVLAFVMAIALVGLTIPDFVRWGTRTVYAGNTPGQQASRSSHPIGQSRSMCGLQLLCHSDRAVP